MTPLLLLALFSPPWTLHPIDQASRGADGVRLHDVNRDGRLDIVTGWEEGGQIRVCYQPERAAIRKPWRCETAGSVGSPEDAVAVDLDSDGRPDIISSSEGKTRAIHIHWNRPSGWTTKPLPAAAGLMQWMFTLPFNIDNRRGIDFFAAGKNEGAQLGWFESPANPRDLAAWRWHPLRPVGWIMTLDAADMNGDGRPDLLFSDRRGPRSGVFWLENTPKRDWPEHPIGAQGREVLFISRADIDGDGLEDVLSSVKPNEIHIHRRLDRAGLRWETTVLPMPPTAGLAKAVRAGDLDGDGQLEIVFSCEVAKGDLEGVMYFKRVNGQWEPRSVAGPPGVKYDLIELIDLDGDGDLDILTCEENENLGVFWYENPHRP